MLFLLDNSKNIGNDGFEKSKNFIVNVAEYFNPGTSRVGLIEFSGAAKVTVPFQQSRKIEETKSVINGIKYQSGEGHSISEAYQTASSYFNSQRIQGGKFVILITAAEHSGVRDDTATVIKKLAMEEQGVKLFVVGVGDKVTQKNLAQYSSGNTNSYVAEDFDDIIGFITKIRGTICKLA